MEGFFLQPHAAKTILRIAAELAKIAVNRVFAQNGIGGVIALCAVYSFITEFAFRQKRIIHAVAAVEHARVV